MKRVHIICEGPTEETFVNELLREPLMAQNVFPFASLVGKPGHKGGRVNLQRILTDVRNRLLGDPSAYCTTFFDFYGLDADFPGKKESIYMQTIAQKAESLEMALFHSVRNVTDEEAIQRFIPYVQMHEFEGLLFSDPNALAQGISEADLANEFHKIRNLFRSPEDINDSPNTAPSKRILKLVVGYEKPLYGALAALEIGLPTIRRECIRFDQWLNQLERLGGKYEN